MAYLWIKTAQGHEVLQFSFNALENMFPILLLAHEMRIMDKFFNFVFIPYATLKNLKNIIPKGINYWVYSTYIF